MKIQHIVLVSLFFLSLSACRNTELPPGAAALQTRSERLETVVSGIESTNYEGIGAFVSVRREEEPRIVLLSVMTDSPAEAAGLQAHDAILAVDGNPIDDANLF